MNINIQTIPHKEQRYETPGDWWFDEKGNLEIRVSDMGNLEYEGLVALHELIEVQLCKKRGITTEQVDAFDKQYEADREKGLHGEDDEPGDDPQAPYKKEHFFATNLECLMCGELGLDFKEYEKTVQALSQSEP
jgi:hypothetical protein